MVQGIEDPLIALFNLRLILTFLFLKNILFLVVVPLKSFNLLQPSRHGFTYKELSIYVPSLPHAKVLKTRAQSSIWEEESEGSIFSGYNIFHFRSSMIDLIETFQIFHFKNRLVSI
jgi:hypothetical protein